MRLVYLATIKLILIKESIGPLQAQLMETPIILFLQSKNTIYLPSKIRLVSNLIKIKIIYNLMIIGKLICRNMIKMED
jgi:hypothetical protein